MNTKVVDDEDYYAEKASELSPLNHTPKDIRPVGEYREYRGIKVSVAQKYGVTMTDKERVYPYPSGGKKIRIFPKEFRTESMKGSAELFGQNLFGSGGRFITITEGEEDAMSAYQMINEGSAYNNPVVSLPSANPSSKLWDNVKDYLNSFEKIILSVDTDEPGNKVAERISQMFPGKVYRVNHGQYKDANDFLQEGKSKEFKNLWWKAERVKPETILCTAEDFLKLYNDTPEHEYFKTGIPELDEKILGIHKGYFTVIKAPTGLGKSEFMRYLEWQALSKTDYKIAVCHLEESKLRGVLGLVSYNLGTNVTRKDLVEKFNLQEKFAQSVEKLTKAEQFYQFSIRTDDTYLDVVDRIKYLVAAMEVDFIFLEPIQDVVNIGNTSEKESQLSDFASILSRLASELNVGIVTIAHTNEDGEIKYCKMIGQKAGFEIVLERDMDNEDHAEANRTYVRVGRKNRVGGGSGPAGALDFDLESYTLTPVKGPDAPVFVDDKGVDF